MLKQDFIQRTQTQIAINKALVYFTEKFDAYVKKYDGQVYNIRLFEEFNKAELSLHEGGAVYFPRASKEDYKSLPGHPIHIYVLREVPALMSDGTPYIDRQSLSTLKFSDDIQFGGFESVLKHKDDTFVTADGRYSYERFQKIAKDAIAQKVNRNQELQKVLDRLDEYESAYNEVCRLNNDLLELLPYELRDKSEIAKTRHRTLFYEEFK
jgi:hypothetical protein